MLERLGEVLSQHNQEIMVKNTDNKMHYIIKIKIS
jgi:hypothetical protein